MLHTLADETDDLSPNGLQTAYEGYLQTTIETVGVDTAIADTDLDGETIEAVVDGETDDLTLIEAADIAALDDNAPDAEAIVLETRDHLLMGMTTAVLDVDAVAAELDADLTGQEVQQAVEGRIKMTLPELAAIQSVIEQRLED